MNALKLILFNLVPLVLILGSLTLHFYDMGKWGWFLGLGIFSHLYVLSNLRDIGNEERGSSE